MFTGFANCFLSECLKTKRSLAFWMAVIGGLFTPSIIIVARLVNPRKLAAIYSADDFWNRLWNDSWESMAIFFLPLGVILSSSLITQIEYKNNTWKQVHTMPLPLTTIFLAKLAVIMTMMTQFFIIFNIGIFLSALVPCLLAGGVPWPKQAIPVALFAKEDFLFFMDCLPIIALQYLISLRFKNFLVPVGLGFLFWVGALAALPWKYDYLVPYTYCMLNYLKGGTASKAVIPNVNFHLLAAGYFMAITIVSYVLYLTKSEKG